MSAKASGASILGAMYLAALAALFYADRVHAIDLDSPVVSRPTVRSEIARGQNSAFTCTSSPYFYPDQQSRCFSAVAQKNVQNNTASLPFLTGMYMWAWFQESIGVKVSKSQYARDVTEQSATTLFAIARDYQKKAGLTVQDICDGYGAGFAGNGCKEIQEQFDVWSSRTGL